MLANRTVSVGINTAPKNNFQQAPLHQEIVGNVANDVSLNTVNLKRVLDDDRDDRQVKHARAVKSFAVNINSNRKFNCQAPVPSIGCKSGYIGGQCLLIKEDKEKYENFVKGFIENCTGGFDCRKEAPKPDYRLTGTYDYSSPLGPIPVSKETEASKLKRKDHQEKYDKYCKNNPYLKKSWHY